MYLIIQLVVPLLGIAMANGIIYGNGTIAFTYSSPFTVKGLQVIYQPEGSMLDIVSQNPSKFDACLAILDGSPNNSILSIPRYKATEGRDIEYLHWSGKGRYFYVKKNYLSLKNVRWILYEVKIYKETTFRDHHCAKTFKTTPYYVEVLNVYEVPEKLGYCELDIYNSFTFYRRDTTCTLVLNGSSTGEFFNFSYEPIPRNVERPPLSQLEKSVMIGGTVVGVIVVCLLIVITVQQMRFQRRRRPNFPMTNRLPTQENDNLPPLTTRVPPDNSYGLPSYEDLPDANLPPDYEEVAMLPDNVSLAETKAWH